MYEIIILFLSREKMLQAGLCTVFFVGIVTSRFCEENARCTNLEGFEIFDIDLCIYIFRFKDVDIFS